MSHPPRPDPSGAGTGRLPVRGGWLNASSSMYLFCAASLDNMSIMAAGAVHFDRYRGIIEGKGLTLACPRMISQLSPSKNLAIHILYTFLISRVLAKLHRKYVFILHQDKSQLGKLVILKFLSTFLCSKMIISF